MANSKYQYVKEFERENYLLPETFIVVRVDGRGFHRFSKFYDFAKPNDKAALECMNQAALGVFKNVQDIILAYGDSDEYSFVFSKYTELFERREAKLVSTVVSTFTAHYIANWPNTGKKALTPHHLPTFDGRAVVYPNARVLRDYVSWRQVDCHINNLYNTTFWALVDKGGLKPDAAEERLRGSLSSDKNEILFSEFGINYNNEPQEYRKGTIIRWKPSEKSELTKAKMSKRQLERKVAKEEIEVLHVDIITNDKFWTELLGESR